MSIESRVVVNSHGNTDATVFFLSGHPLKNDLLSGMALSGPAESTLNQFLYPVKLNVKNCFRSLWIKEKLEYGGTNPKKLRAALEKVDVQEYTKILREEINEVKPIVIVPLDDMSLGIVFPHINAIRKPKGRKYWLQCYRGSILPLREDWQQEIGYDNFIKVIPTFGPQLLYNDWTARSYVNLDYKKIANEQFARNRIEPFGLEWVARDSTSLKQFFDRQLSLNPKRVTFDVETYYGLLTCISFCFDGYESVTVPLVDPSISKFEIALMWRLVAFLLANPNIEKNNQNIKYDWIILERHGFVVNNVKSDTLLKGALLYPELPKGLDFWTSIYTPIPYYKDEGKEYNPRLHTRDKLYIYCAKDSLAAHNIATAQDAELEDVNLTELYQKEIAPSILIYKNMDETGITVDPQIQQKLLNKYTTSYENNLYILRSLVGDPKYNPNSPKMVGRVIYEELKYPPRRKIDPETGRSSWKTDKNTLDDLLINIGEKAKAGKIGYNILTRQIVCRKLSKIIELIKTPLHADGKLRGSANLAGTETGRSSSNKTIDERFRLESIEGAVGPQAKATKRLGRSLQTISKHGFHIDEEVFVDFEDATIAKDLRSMFVPRHKDFVFIEVDGNGAEARVVFVLANDFDALAAMDQRPKLHAKTAAILFDVDPAIITSTEPSVPRLGISYYDLGKRVRHAGHYDMQAFVLSQMTHLPIATSEMHLQKFHGANPKIRNVFHLEITNFLQLNRFLVAPNGRRRDFFARYDNSLLKEGYSYIPQATISDLTKFTMWRVAEELEGYMSLYFFLAEMHDGIFSEVHKDLKEKYFETFKRIYERPINFSRCSISRDFDLIIPAEVSWSDTNWMDLKEVKL